MIRYGMPRADYDALPGEHWSTIKHVARSPAHYLHAVSGEDEDRDTDVLAFGRGLHLALLEPERYPLEVAVWNGGTRRGHAWDAFVALHAGRELLTGAQHQRILEMAASVTGNHATFALLIGGNSEVSITWTDAATGIDCKARLDYVRDSSAALHSEGGIIDIKTCRDASPDAFGRAAIRYGYHAQAALYTDGLAAVTLLGRPLPYSILAIESSPPYVAQVYRIHEEALELGRDEYRRCLERVSECRRAGTWPGYSEGPMDVQLPKWAWGAEDDIGALGLDLGEEPASERE
jgi:hypothetical protein